MGVVCYGRCYLDETDNSGRDHRKEGLHVLNCEPRTLTVLRQEWQEVTELLGDGDIYI
jgi:hypothetical protein